MNTIEKIIEYNYITSLLQAVSHSKADVIAALKEKPFDIQLQATLRKIDNDLPLLFKHVKELGSEINKALESKVCKEGEQFQFIPTNPTQFQ
jgi:hypothetical protein